MLHRHCCKIHDTYMTCYSKVVVLLCRKSSSLTSTFSNSLEELQCVDYSIPRPWLWVHSTGTRTMQFSYGFTTKKHSLTSAVLSERTFVLVVIVYPVTLKTRWVIKPSESCCSIFLFSTELGHPGGESYCCTSSDKWSKRYTDVPGHIPNTQVCSILVLFNF